MNEDANEVASLLRFGGDKYLIFKQQVHQHRQVGPSLRELHGPERRFAQVGVFAP